MNNDGPDECFRLQIQYFYVPVLAASIDSIALGDDGQDRAMRALKLVYEDRALVRAVPQLQ